MSDIDVDADRGIFSMDVTIDGKTARASFDAVTGEYSVKEVEAPKTEEPKPIGKGIFGGIYDQFKGKVKEAFDFLMKHKTGDLLGVFHRNDVGDIDLVWGDNSCGFAHIVSKHVGKGKSFETASDAIAAIDDIIKSGKVDFENGDKVVLKKGTQKVTIRKNFREKGVKKTDKKWILTAYNETSADSESTINGGIQGVAVPTTDVSEDKGTTKVEENQTENQNNIGDQPVAPEQPTQKRRGNFFASTPEEREKQAQEDAAAAAAKAEQEIKDKYNALREEFKDANPKTNEYAAALQNNEDVAGAVAELRAKAEEQRKVAEDWRQRKYKKNSTVVEGTSKFSALDTYKTTFGAANERRRRAAIDEALRAAEEYDKMADKIVKETGYKEPVSKDKQASAPKNGPTATKKFTDLDEAYTVRDEAVKKAEADYRTKLDEFNKLLPDRTDEWLATEAARLNENYYDEYELPDYDEDNPPTQAQVEEDARKMAEANILLPFIWKEQAKRKNEDLWAKARRAAKQPVIPKKVKKIDPFSYAVDKNATHKVFQGAYYSKGKMHITDGTMIVEVKADYPIEYEGTIRNKQGVVIEGKYPDTARIFNIIDQAKAVDIDVDAFRRNVARGLEASKALKSVIAVEIGTGRNVGYFEPAMLKKALDLIDTADGKVKVKLYVQDNKPYIYVEDKKRRAVFLGLLGVTDQMYSVRDGIVMRARAEELDADYIKAKLELPDLKPAERTKLEYQLSIAENPLYTKPERPLPTNIDEARKDYEQSERNADTAIDDYNNFIAKWGKPKDVAEAEQEASNSVRSLAEEVARENFLEERAAVDRMSKSELEKWLKDNASVPDNIEDFIASVGPEEAAKAGEARLRGGSCSRMADWLLKADARKIIVKQMVKDALAKKQTGMSKLDSYLDSMKPFDRARRRKVLSVKTSYNGKVMTSAEFIEQGVSNGRQFGYRLNEKGNKEYYVEGDGRETWSISKTEYEYAEHLGAKMMSESDVELEEAKHEYRTLSAKHSGKTPLNIDAEIARISKWKDRKEIAQRIAELTRMKELAPKYMQWLKAHDKNLYEYYVEQGWPTGTEDNAGEGIRFRFIGEKGAARLDKAQEATTRLDNLGVAREMESAGMEAKAIKMATGWERGADGKWRYETADFKDVKVSDGTSRLSDVIDDNELFAAYPELKDLPVEFRDLGPGVSASMVSEAEGKPAKIVVNSDRNLVAEDELKGMFIHEIQHAIQGIEGFARGSSEDEQSRLSGQPGFNLSGKAINDARKLAELAESLPSDITAEQLRDMAKEQSDRLKRIELRMMYVMMKDGATMPEIARQYRSDYEGMIKRMEQNLFSADSPYNRYIRVAGEVEARNAANRTGMSDEQRRALLAADTEDVAREDQIFLMDNLGESEMGSKVSKRMREIADKLGDAELDERQQAVVDVFTGAKDNEKIVVKREDGQHTVVMRQGNETGAGTKHSLYRHYGTGVGVIEAEDLKMVPKVLEEGVCTEKQRSGTKLNEYKYLDGDGVTYTVITEVRNRAEVFNNFYTNKNSEPRTSRRALKSDANTPEGAHSFGSEFDDAKLGNNSEMRKPYSAENVVDATAKRGVRIVNSIDELPEGSVARRAIEQDKTVKGWFDPKTGEAYIFMPNIKSVEDLMQTFRHEGVAHMGLRELLGKDKFSELCDQVWEQTMEQSDRDRMMAYVHDMSDKEYAALSPEERAKLESNQASQRAAADEYMAFMGENGDYNKAGTWQRIVDWVRNALRKLGINLKVTKEDVMSLLRKAEVNTMPQSEYEAEVSNVRFRTSEDIEKDYPNWLEGTTTDSGKHTTQVEGTRKTYNKVGTWIENNLGKDVSILDASSGMGYGTADLRERGFNIEDVEPYQSEERKANNPATYDSYNKLNKQYDYVISNAVLNVIPDDWRANVLHNMADALKDGGKMFINTRKAGEEKAIKDKIELDTPQEVLVKRNGKIASYQKFYTPAELKEWVESELGDGYTVEIANEANSGTKGLAAVVVTKNNESLTKSKASGLGQPIAEADAPMVIFDAKLRKNQQFANELSNLIDFIGDKGSLGAHEFLYSLAKSFGIENESFNEHAYIDLDGGVSLRIADHYGNAKNFANKYHAENNLGIVIKLKSPQGRKFARFKDYDGVDYLEYVFFPDKISSELRQQDIVRGLQNYLTTGDIGKLPTPDKYNGSGKFKEEAKRLNYELSEANQIKSATENNGEFSSNDDIRFRKSQSDERMGENAGLSIAERADKIKELSPVEVNSNTLSKDELINIYSQLRSISKDGHEIKFYKSAFKKIYKDGGLFGQVLPKLDTVLENSVFAYSEEDNLGGTVRSNGSVHKEHKNVLSFDNYIGKCRLNGQDYYVRFTVQQSVNEAGTHSFFVSNVALYENTTESRTIPITSRGTTDFSGVTDAKLVKFFEQANEERKKELQREGTGAYSDSEVSYENDPWAKALGEDFRTEKQQKQFAARERKRMVVHVKKLAKALHLDNVDILTDTEGLEGKRATAKGFFNPRTGKITIVIPNHATAADAVRTLLHESVAHFGLRKLFGEHFTDFLDNVYQNADKDIRSTIVDMAKKQGWDFRKATEEYLARLAEDTDFENTSTSWWGKIKKLFFDMLNKIGFKGFGGVTLSDNELRYILWRSYENMKNPGKYRSFMTEAEDIVKQSELKVGNYAEEATPGSEAAGESINSANAHFNEQMKRYIDGKMNKNEFFVLGTPSAVMSAFLPPLPIVMRQRILTKGTTKKHNVDVSALMNMPEKISRPIFVFQRDNNTIGVLTEIKDRDGKNLCVAIELSKDIQDGSEFLSVNDILTFHGREAQNIINPILKNGTLKWVDKEKGLAWLSSASQPDQQEIASQDLSSAAKVIKDFENPIIESEINDDNDLLMRDGGDIEDYITKYATELSTHYMDDKKLRDDAVKAIGKSLDSIRKAMAAQRKFDVSTIKRVADMARNLIETGFLRDMGNGDIKNVISAIKNSVSGGEKTYQDAVQRVFDIMVGNHLKQSQNVFEKLLHTTGSKVDAKGVEVQGELDVNGQRMLYALKHSMDLPYEAYDASGELLNDTILGKLNEALNRIGDDTLPQTVRDEASNEYAGLQIAARYAQEVADSKADEKALRQSIKDAKADYDAGNITQEAYQQLCKTVEDAIRKNHLDRAEAYRELTKDLAEMLNGSIDAAKQFRDAQLERVKEIQHNANSDLEGRPANAHRDPDWKEKVVNSDLMQFFMRTLPSFAEMLRMFGSKSAKGEGYLFNRFMRGWVDAANTERTSKNETFDILNQKAAEVLDKKKARWSDLAAKVRKTPLRDGRKSLTVEVWDDGAMRQFELRQGNLMYIYMANKMTDGAMKLRRMGITEEQVEQIADLLDPRIRDLADWLQDEFFVNTREKYNEVHKRLFGASMAAIDNYVPLKILDTAIDRQEDIGNLDKNDKKSSTTTGAIIKRVRNNKPLDILHADAFNVVTEHVNDMEHWAAFSELSRDLNTLLSYRKFANRVRNMTTTYGGGKNLFNTFRKACSIAKGDYLPDAGRSDKYAVNLAKLATMAKVSLRVFTAWKQLASMPAYLPDSNPAVLAKNLATPWVSFRWALQNLPLFEKRWVGRMTGEEKLLPNDMDMSWWRKQRVQWLQRKGMAVNAFFDAVTVAVGARSIYESKYGRYVKQGYSRMEADRRAKQDATILFNETQQSSEAAFVSQMQTERSWFSVMATAFRNASIGYQRKLLDAQRQLIKKIFSPGYKETSIEFMRKQHERAGLDPDQAIRAAQQDYNHSWLHDIVQLGTFGYIMQGAWYLMSSAPYLFFGSDDDEKKKTVDDSLIHAAIGGHIEGLTFGDIISEGITALVRDGELSAGSFTKDMPIAADIEVAIDKFGYDKVAMANDIICIVVESGLGVNPQTISDAVTAIWDYCGQDEKTIREFCFMTARIFQAPQSQLDKAYFDELGCDGEQAKKLTPVEVAKRYAAYKVMKGAGAMAWAYPEDLRAKREASYQSKAISTIKERMSSMWSDDVNKRYDRAEADYNSVRERMKDLRANDEDLSLEEIEQRAARLADSPKYYTYATFKRVNNLFKKEVERYLEAKNPVETDKHRQAVKEIKPLIVDIIYAETTEQRDAAVAKLRDVITEANK